MSRKRSKPRKWKANPLAYLRTIAGVSPLVGEQQTDLALAYRFALHDMREGCGTDTAYNTLAGAINMAMVLAEKGYGAEYKPQIEAAQDGLVRCYDREQGFGCGLAFGGAVEGETTA